MRSSWYKNKLNNFVKPFQACSNGRRENCHASVTTVQSRLSSCSVQTVDKTTEEARGRTGKMAIRAVSFYPADTTSRRCFILGIREKHLNSVLPPLRRTIQSCFFYSFFFSYPLSMCFALLVCWKRGNEKHASNLLESWTVSWKLLRRVGRKG